jgi:peroxiredoxin
MLLVFCSTYEVSAELVELKGKITFTSGGGMPATAILRSAADESYMGTANIDKDGGFFFQVNVSRATLFTLRFLRVSYDIMLSPTEKVTNFSVTMSGDQITDIKVENSRENEAYKTFKPLVNMYDGKLIAHFRLCEKEDSCEKVLNSLLKEYAHELSIIQENFKGTYTADVLCRMKMPTIAKNVKNTSDEFRKGFFENIDFSDSTILFTPVYKELLAGYIDYFIDATLISKQKEFIKFITDKIKSNPVVMRKSATLIFDEVFRAGREKMLAMLIDWYNTGDNKTSINNMVMDLRIKNIARVMPGQTYIDVNAPDAGGTVRGLKDVVEKSKCTLLLFWSSECSHCRDEMPLIKECYEKYHAKGFDIYAVSLEQDPEKWKDFVTTKGLTWTNVITNRVANPNPATEYVSSSTPTLVLIDSKGVILHRFMPKTTLENHIVEALK